jgi:uncharacterized protein (TIGR03083 family)
MELDFGMVRKALRAQCGTVSRLLLNLPEHEFARPTRLRPWDVLHLAAHLYRDLERVPFALQERQPARSADTDVVTYWHYDRIENAARTQARADLIVGNYGSGAALASAFDAMQQQAIFLVDNTNPDVVVRTWEPIMRVDDFAATRVVEVTIHGLDLACALELAPEMDDEPWPSPLRCSSGSSRCRCPRNSPGTEPNGSRKPPAGSHSRQESELCSDNSRKHFPSSPEVIVTSCAEIAAGGRSRSADRYGDGNAGVVIISVRLVRRDEVGRPGNKAVLTSQSASIVR